MSMFRSWKIKSSLDFYYNKDRCCTFERPYPLERSFWQRQFGKYFHPPWPLSDGAEVVICVSEVNCNIYLGPGLLPLARTWQGNNGYLFYRWLLEH